MLGNDVGATPPGGGEFVVWNDPRAGASELDGYPQRIDATGRIAWQADFPAMRPLCTASSRQFLERLSPDEADGAIATRHDERGVPPKPMRSASRRMGRAIRTGPSTA